MGRGEKMAKTTELTAKATISAERLRVQFKEKFGHAYDTQGFHGHPLFGYHCYGCGIHISQVTGKKSLREQLELDLVEAQSGLGRRMENTGTEVINVP